jgi:tetratricopeptide (TPR) repeat protein
MAEEKTCAEALESADHFGDEDRDLPFTFHGFGALLKSPRLQFYFGAAESLCGDEKGARKIWAKIAKLTRDVGDADFAYPFLASALIGANQADARARIEEALAHLKNAPATDGTRANLLYSEGLLFRALGQEKDAMRCFVEAAKSPDPPLTSYLARAALAEGARLRLVTGR